jgi:hypothetical protein
VIVRFALSLLLALVAVMVVKSLPDIARYLKMREM